MPEAAPPGVRVAVGKGLEAAIEGVKDFLKVAGDGTVELRQILEFAPQPA